jgi:hypothetical protein
LLPLAVDSAGAQRRAPLDEFAAVVEALDDAAGPQQLPPCPTATTARFCEFLVRLSAAEVARTKQAASPLRAAAEQLVVNHPASPEAWYLLGRTRLALDRAGLFAQEGARTAAGLSLNAGAIRAFAQSVRLAPHFRHAVAALATVPLPREGRRGLEEAVALLREQRSRLDGPGLAAAALVERGGGSVDSAVVLGQRALAAGGVDNGLILFELARDLHRIGRDSAGRNALAMGATYRSARADRAYRSELEWIATPAELAAWDSLGAQGRDTFLVAFWGKRDVLEGRREGERLAEHYRRVEFALEHYRLQIPQVGRQEFLTFSRPTDYLREYGIRDGASKSFGMEDLNRFVIDSRAMGSESPFRYYTPVQDLIDDRGVVYIRQGPPTRIAKTTGGDALELWAYDHADGTRLLSFRDADFDGTVGASVLVPTLLTMPAPMRVQICHLDETLCPAFPRFTESTSPMVLNEEIIKEGQRLSSDAIRASRDRGRGQIDTATTTDRYSRDFEKRMEPIAQVYGLRRLPSGGGRVVLGFALRGARLDSVTTPGSGGRVIYPIRIQASALRLTDGKRFDLDTLRQFATPAPLRDDEHLTGLMDFPLPAGRYALSAVFTQTTGRGAVASMGEVVVPEARSVLTTSDLVIGNPASSVRWPSGLSEVALHPLNAFRVGDDAELYVQVGGASVGAPYRIRYDFFRIEQAVAKTAQLSIGFEQNAPATAWEIRRTAGLGNLEPGRYLVRVTVAGDGVTTESSARLTLRGR